MEILQPSISDFDALTELWEASVRATHIFLKEGDIKFFKPLVRSQYLAAVNLYCIKNNNTIKGFIGTMDNSIEMLFVHPSARGTGIGKVLLQFALKELQCTKVDVNEQNEQAVGFYLKQGFTITGRSETDAMGKPYPILHMALK
jgi:putative acetyltransferase